jgi:hypothetical protein
MLSFSAVTDNWHYPDGRPSCTLHPVRRAVALVVAGTLVGVGACSSSERSVANPSPTAPTTLPTNPRPASLTTSTLLNPAGLAQCRTSQLSASFAGIGAVGGGQWGATYWVRNPSPEPCRLPGSTVVELLDGRGDSLRRLTSTHSTLDVGLPANVAMPPHPLSPGTIASFMVLFTPIDMPDGGVDCRQPMLVPAAIRVTFGGVVGPITIHDVAADGQRIAICEDAVGIDPVTQVS